MVNKIDIVSTGTFKKEEEEFLDFYLGETQEEAEETYHNFSKLLNIVSYSYSMNTGIEQSELFGAALEGLARAKRDWDHTRGNCTFKSYAMLRIKTAMHECCRKNKSIVSIPEYIRVANIYIRNIKTILEGYNEPPESIERIIRHRDARGVVRIHKVDKARLEAELDKLGRLASNCGVPYLNLIKRAEFVPTDAYFDDTMTQEEMYEAERRRMAAALMVSKLQDKMTPTELHIANGIMAGKSYGEIGRTHDPKRSIAWVQQQIEKMREKFNDRT